MKKILFVLTLYGLLPVGAHAAGIPTLDEVAVTAKSTDQLGVAATSSEGTVTAEQLENRPLLRPAEVLEVVPGLIISQHSGDGKANQYYLRGFNLDHGTDFSTSLMGMPVNMPTHAHGQGYNDLNFLIPELVERVQYRKGTYYAGDGDFSAAGSARIDYVRKLDAPFAQMTLGGGGFSRLLAAASPTVNEGNLLIAAEGYHNDGPWTVPEHLRKDNLVVRYGQGQRDDGWVVSLLGYDAKWTATDQIAERAMATVGRYGTLDPSTGGDTHRYSLSGEWADAGADGASRANVYLIDYALNLWSNFTYATDTVHGDQFLQADKRTIVGAKASHNWLQDMHGIPVITTIGTDVRHDDIGVGLFSTQNRATWGTVRDDKVKQTSVSLWGETQLQWTEKFRSILGLRGDSYQFDVNSNTAANSGNKSDAIVSPKLSLVFGPWDQTEYYLNAGRGFHSNDARGITISVNPDPRPGTRPGCTGVAGECTGDAVDPVRPLVPATGYEVGVRSAILPGLQTSLTLWRLDIDSELVFVGDAGTTSASRPSRRQGVEWANYWNPVAWLLVDGDVSLSSARFTDSDPVGNRIPGAIEQAASVGVSLQESDPWSAGLRLRYFGPRPLIEDNSIRSKSSTLVNLMSGYKISKQVRLSLEVLNLLDTQVSDIDYYYESQLVGEASPVADIHSHPAEPRTLRLTLRVML
ncbi:MAG TPA: TonB-dependent receptor [Gallionellaceae bacterium]|nr:TonB-dependent receptor [Gallionellaceae bacterium]